MTKLHAKMTTNFRKKWIDQIYITGKRGYYVKGFPTKSQNPVGILQKLLGCKEFGSLNFRDFDLGYDSSFPVFDHHVPV